MADLISIDQWRKIFPRAPIEFLDAFNNHFLENGIDTINKAAGFLSQTAVETACFTQFFESTNYDTKGLLKTFGKYFNHDASIADMYSRKPIAIANRVYGNRMGNGGEDTGDGYRYRGKGLIQLTGKNNYIQYAEYKKCKVEDAAAFMESFEGMLDSTFWYWRKNNCNKWCHDIDKLSRLVNTGNPNSKTVPNGMEDRRDIYGVVRAVLRGDNYPGKGFGGPIGASGKHLLSGAKDSNGNYANTSPASMAARDSNMSSGAGTKTGKRIKLTKDFYRDNFACPTGCGANTVDTLIVSVLQKLSNQLQNRPIKIHAGTVCSSYTGLSCDQKAQHILGKAVDIEVLPWQEKNFPAMNSKDIVKLLENLFGDIVFCYAINDTLVHVDVGNT